MYGLKHLSPAISSSYIYLQPVLVMLFAVLFSAIGIAEDYTNTINFNKIIYMLMIFLGVYIISRKRKL
jgi:drug/metabolite transporter (DMT)-like permease